MTEFTCDMDGYVDIVTKQIKNILFLPTLLKETYVYMLPEDLGKALEFSYDGFLSIFAFLGYVISIAYYVGLEYGFGAPICSLMTTIAGPINTIYGYVDFATIGDEADATA